MKDGVIWHDVECGPYAADLPLWVELADEAGGPVLDLGCGTGRVALHLARRGHAMVGLDVNPDLIAALADRAEELPIDAVAADAREFELSAEFQLVLAPMQLVQMLGGADERERCLRCVAGHLTPRGRAAFAIVEGMPGPMDAPPPPPDTREVDGWVYSSLPIEGGVEAELIRVRRLRQTVSPAGRMSEDMDEVLLRTLDAATLEGEARMVGLRPTGRRAVPPTADHVGSTIVLLEKGL